MNQPVPLLEIRRLRVEFPDRRNTFVALDQVDLGVMRGEIVGVVGESGAGKSTLGAAIAGLLEPPGRIASGEILYSGQRLDNLSEKQRHAFRGREISVIFQDPLSSLDPLMRVGDQLVETITTHCEMSMKTARLKAIALLDEVGIADPSSRVNSYPHQLSGGMRQRIVIALALCSEPRLIVADEPTTALDVTIQAKVIAMLRRVCHERRTAMLLITHDMGVVAQICDRVVVMYGGRIVESGPTKQVILQPSHPYTMGLIRCIPQMTQRLKRLPKIAEPINGERFSPSGCAFVQRCDQAFDRCQDDAPPPMHAGKVIATCWRLDPRFTISAMEGEHRGDYVNRDPHSTAYGALQPGVQLTNLSQEGA